MGSKLTSTRRAQRARHGERGPRAGPTASEGSAAEMTTKDEADMLHPTKELQRKTFKKELIDMAAREARRQISHIPEPPRPLLAIADASCEAIQPPTTSMTLAQDGTERAAASFAEAASNTSPAGTSTAERAAP